MTALSRQARDEIKLNVIGQAPPRRGEDRPRDVHATIAGFIGEFYADGVWGGDTCGCLDDRCVGYHHDENEDCGCFKVWLDEYLEKARREHLAGLAELVLAS